MSIHALIGQLQSATEDNYRELVSGLGLSHYTDPIGFAAMIYDPLICLILQGQKEILIGNERVVISAGESIIVSHAMPVISRVTLAAGSIPPSAGFAP